MSTNIYLIISVFAEPLDEASQDPGKVIKKQFSPGLSLGMAKKVVHMISA